MELHQSLNLSQSQAFYTNHLLAADHRRSRCNLHTAESSNVNQLCRSSHWLYFLYSFCQKVWPSTSIHRFDSPDAGNIVLDIQDAQFDRAIHHQPNTRPGWCNQRVDCRDNCTLTPFLRLRHITHVVQIADLFFVHHRGTMNGLYMTCVMMGVCFYPIPIPRSIYLPPNRAS
jgi:hypothetical protein